MLKKIYLLLQKYPLIKSILFLLGKLLLLFSSFIYRCSKRYSSIHTKLMYYIEWGLSKNSPSSFKHEINLYNWIYEPKEADFVQSASIARAFLKTNDMILDLCCGDGSYAYLFFSDIAKKIDAIDYNTAAINYAKKHYKKENISYQQANLLHYSFKQSHYQMVIWSAGVAYFTKKEREMLFKKINESLIKDGCLYITTPLEKEAHSKIPSANQIDVITSKTTFEKEFNKLFKIEFRKEIKHTQRVTLVYILKKT